MSAPGRPQRECLRLGERRAAPRGHIQSRAHARADGKWDGVLSARWTVLAVFDGGARHSDDTTPPRRPSRHLPSRVHAFAVGGGLLVLWRRGWAACICRRPPGRRGPSSPARSARSRRGSRRCASRRAQAGYDGSFVDHYLVPLIYPAGLTPGMQIALGVVVLAVNVAIYAAVWRRLQPRSRAP